MQSWQTTYLGLKDLPRELSAFELQTFFTFSQAERAVIDIRRSRGRFVFGVAHAASIALRPKLAAYDFGVIDLTFPH